MRPAVGQVVERRRERGRTFGIRYRANGRRVYETVGSTTEGCTREQAEEALRDRLAEIRLGIWVDPDEELDPTEPAPAPIFSDFAREWLAGCKADGLGVRTIEDYTWAVDLHLVPVLGRLRVDAIGVREVDAYRRAKSAEGVLAPNSVNKTITRLSQILALAVEHELIPANPAAGKRRRLKRTPTRQTWCEPAQVMALLEAAEGRLLDRGRPLLATLAGAGPRIGEALAFKWRDVDFGRGELHVRASKTEAGERTIDLTPALRAELAAWRERTAYPALSDYLFPNRRGGQDNRNNIRRRLLEPAVQKANEKLVQAGIEPITALTPHGLRRTYASLRHAVGDEVVYTSTQLGHADVAFSLNVYTFAAKRRERMSAAEREAAERAYEWAAWSPLGTSAHSPDLRVVSGENAPKTEAA